MLNWIRNFFKPDEPRLPTLRDRYWEKHPSLIRREVGKYEELSLGWIHDSLIYVPDLQLKYKSATIGSGACGWYRHQLAVL